MPPAEAVTLAEAAARLAQSGRVRVFIHRSPDGDAVGSAFALTRMLRQRGCEARVVCADPIPQRLEFLTDGQHDVRCTDADGAPDVLRAAVDVAAPGQLGALAPLADTITLSLDHHGIGTPWCAHYTDPTASAAGEILARLYRMLCDEGTLRPDAAVARALYAAIVSDTGGFTYANTTPETMRIGAALLSEIAAASDGGDDAAMICHRLLASKTMSELRAERLCLDALTLAEDGRLGAVLITQRMLEENGLCEEDLANCVNLPRSVAGVQIALSIRQTQELTAWRVSARAVGDADVAAVCAVFGGGGHRRAAGCTITAPDADAALSLALGAFRAALPPEAAS